MQHLIWIGEPEPSPELVALLRSSQRVLTWFPEAVAPPALRRFAPDLLVAETGDQCSATTVGELAGSLGVPWLACPVVLDETSAREAFEAGASGVLPRQLSPAGLTRLVDRILAGAAPEVGERLPPGRVRVYPAGESISLSADSVLEVLEGIVMMSVLHDDGEEVMLALLAPGEVTAGHPDDRCALTLRAHTPVRVAVRSWSALVGQPVLCEKLRHRLRQLEAWASIQARPHIGQRLIGVLSLLAAAFGREEPDGIRVDLRITHAQLASAVRATRSTVTRQLGQLRRSRALRVSGTGAQERLHLCAVEACRHARSHR